MPVMGTVKKLITYEDEAITAFLIENNGQEYEFYLTNTTWLVDGAGFPATAESLVNKTVIVAHDAAMTMSLPPKAIALAVMVNDDILPNYAVVEDVTVHQDGTVTVTTDQGNRLVTIAMDAQVSPFRTRNIITAQDLRPGDTVVLYYDVLAPSIPAKASTDRVVRLASV